MKPIEPYVNRTRRDFLTTAASSLGLAALGSMLSDDGLLSPATVAAEDDAAAAANPLAVRPPHFEPRAKSCIFLFQAGGPSHLDLFDPKPKLNELDGQPLPQEMLEKVRFAFINKENATLLGSPRTWSKHGECGMDFSDFVPHLAYLCRRSVDDPFAAQRTIQPSSGSVVVELRAAHVRAADHR